MTPDEKKARLAELQPEIPWSHYFDLGDDIYTVSPQNEKYFNKAVGLEKLAKLIPGIVARYSNKGDLNELTVLDVGCGEGLHSIYMARHGAIVTGAEGRKLYVDRARFIADSQGVKNISFVQCDCRKLRLKQSARFDLVFCSGVLHHLDQPSFFKFVKSLYDFTKDVVVIYCHVSTPKSIERFRLNGPVYACSNSFFFSKKYTGYLFQEHKENSTEEDKLNKVRASLDNVHSFWPTLESLIEALNDVGFSNVTISSDLHIFTDNDKKECRPIIIAKK